VQLFFTNKRKVWQVGQVAGLSHVQLTDLFERRRIPAGTPILLDATRGLDLRSATESGIQEFRQWRREDAEETVGEATWDRDSAAISGLYDFLLQDGFIEVRPWRATGRRAVLRSGTSRDLRVRHMELEQYLYCRDVGFGGLAPDAQLDETFRGWRPHRNRAACELALMTGMRIQEWATLLLPELGLETGLRPLTTDVALAACAKYGRPRSVHVPRTPGGRRTRGLHLPADSRGKSIGFGPGAERMREAQ
jgi:hypothetical protein